MRIEHTLSLPFQNSIIASSRVGRGLAQRSHLSTFPPAFMPHRGGSRKGPKGEVPRDVQISKAMSLTLRHRAISDGLKMDKTGYVNVADLVSFLTLGFQSLSNNVSFVHELCFPLTARVHVDRWRDLFDLLSSRIGTDLASMPKTISRLFSGDAISNFTSSPSRDYLTYLAGVT